MLADRTSHDTGDRVILKRRRVRKGTQSCWECRRRKIKCTFVQPKEKICDGCRSRNAKCIGQEYVDEQELAQGRQTEKTQVASRIQHGGMDSEPASAGKLFSQPARPTDATNYRTENTHKRDEYTRHDVWSSNIQNTPNLTSQIKKRYEEVCAALLAVWPTEYEFDTMTSISVAPYMLSHGTVCLPYPDFLKIRQPIPSKACRLPPSGSHPIFVARSIMLLAIFLQGIQSEAARKLESVGIRYREIMSRMVDTASRLVSRNDDLIDSLEGIECIMMESVYHNNAGNPRQAWRTNRRAMSTAQMMGLHLEQLPPINTLDTRTRQRIEPKHMWFRVVTCDRYLSLMLGLPQGISESAFTNIRTLQSCQPLERMERMQSQVAGLLIQRNKEDSHNLEVTLKLDQMLQDAAAVMPAWWWLAPNMTTRTGSDDDLFTENLRIINQFTHYHIMAQLHLPYILQPTSNPMYDYSKITTVNASREILLRFIHFHDSIDVATYCRGIDFLAFIASTTLCVAHINVCRQREMDTNSSGSVSRFPTQQRLANRGLVERTLHVMEDMARNNHDAVADRIANVLRPLLLIEAAATYPNDVSIGQTRRGYKLCVELPHLGTIRFENNGVINFTSMASKLDDGHSRTNPVSGISNANNRASFMSNYGSAPTAWPLEGNPLSTASSWTGQQMGVQPVQAVDQTMPLQHDTMQLSMDFQPVSGDVLGVADDYLGIDGMHIPDMGFNENAWALQGADMVLFENLFDGI